MGPHTGAAAFWIALAAVLIAIGWFRSRREQMKHETIRRIVEKGGQVNEEQLKALFQPAVPGWSEHSGAGVPQPGFGYRTLRIIGAVVISLAAGLAAFGGIAFAIFMPHGVSLGEQADLHPVFAVAAGIAVFGCGLFFCSHLMPKPRAESSGRNDRT